MKTPSYALFLPSCCQLIGLSHRCFILTDTIIEEDEMDMREPEPAEFDPAGPTGQVGVNAQAQQPLSDLLVDRLEEVEGVEENEAHVCESPLDYGYEGEDGTESAGPTG